MTSDFASRQRFEQQQADARKGEAAVARSGASLAGEQNQLAVLRSQQREEQARLQQARANLQLAQNDLDNTVIRSPVSRIAGNRAGRSVVRQSQDPTTVAGAAAACLCYSEFQGNPADAHAAGTARRGVGRCLS